MIRRVLAIAAIGAALLTTGPAAAAGPADPQAFTQAELDGSVSALETGVSVLNDGLSELDTGIEPMSTRREEGAETVVTLNTDILFGFGESTISDQAAAGIRALVADLPRDVALHVGGHTDAIGSDEDNQRLSQARARTVAEVIAATRPDLGLDVQGYGESRPVAPNATGGEDDPDGRAQNRRVELRYQPG